MIYEPFQINHKFKFEDNIHFSHIQEIKIILFLNLELTFHKFDLTGT